MEITKVSTEIETQINEIRKSLGHLKERAEEKAKALAEYDKAMAKTIMKLKNGIEFEIDGITIQNPQATLIEKIARGICYQEKINMELAEANYKNLIVGIDSLQAILSAWQSINRYLEKI